MNIETKIARIALALLLLAAAPMLWAHAEVTETWPEKGASVEGSPEVLGVAFNEEMRLTVFEVSGPNGAVPLESEPGREAAATFKFVPAEELVAGDYTVNWRGLAADGHLMSGRFAFTVDD
jgi:copper resistance protein C